MISPVNENNLINRKGNSTGNGILIDDNLNVQVDLGGSTGTGGGPGGVYGKFGKGG